MAEKEITKPTGEKVTKPNEAIVNTKPEISKDTVAESKPKSASVEKTDQYAEKPVEEEKPAEDKPYKRETPTERTDRETRERLEIWHPKTQLGKDVLHGKLKNIDEVLESGKKIMEDQMVDTLLKLDVELVNIGQSKGKFGGGKRRAWRQTQKKTKEGNIPTFAVMAVVGDGKGHMGVGFGRAKETLPAKEKAIRKAKLNIQKIRRGCGSYDCSCEEPHSIPLSTGGKCSSVRVKLMPAAQGTGLVAGDELKKVLKLAGIRDIYSKTFGKTRTTLNTVKACLQALDKLGSVKI